MAVDSNGTTLAALQELAAYFGGRSEVDGQAFKVSEGKLLLDRVRSTLHKDILPKITRSELGGVTAQQLAELLKSIDPTDVEDARKIIAITTETDAGDFGTAVKPSDCVLGFEAGGNDLPSKDKTSVSAIQVFPVDLSFSGRSNEILDVFFNGIPNIEWSRCVPFFDLMIVSSRFPTDGEGRPITMSQSLFLSSGESLDPDIDMKIATAKPEGFKPPGGADEDEQFTVSGMELFTSPQTLVNADNEYFEVDETGQGGPAILDRFSPFMTIKSFDVNVTPSFGLQGFKKAKMSLTLHDRSRLGQIEPLVQPDMYGKTELRVEYGWSHPAINDPGTNPMGEFLNSLRVKEKYGIINSSFSFTDDGQVDINLELAMRGASDSFTANVNDTTTSSNLLEQLDGTVERLQEELSRIRGANTKLSDVVGKTIIPASSSTSSVLRISDEDRVVIQEFIKNRANKGSELQALLEQLFGTKGDDGQRGEIIDSSSSTFRKKIGLLRDVKDPFASRFPSQAMTTADYGNDFSIRRGEMNRSHCSLGKLLMNFVGAPLAASGKFDEVQFIFYSFNRLAGHVRHHNIAQFPIKVSDFESKFDDEFPLKDCTIRQFIDFINREFIQDEFTSKVYRLNKFYNLVSGSVELKSKYENPSALADAKTQSLKEAYPENSSIEFRKPQLQMVMEAVPGITFGGSEAADSVDEEKTILRIFMFDKSATTSESQAMIYNSLARQNFGISQTTSTEQNELDNGFEEQGSIAGHNERFAKVLANLDASGAIELPRAAETSEGTQAPTENLIKPRVSARALKEALKRTAPSCLIGSTGNPVINAQLSSMNDPALASIRIANNASSKGSATGNDDQGFPTFVQPTQLNVTMFGMPLISYGTEVFFDFGTNTNVDNFYVCTGIDHSFSPGEFRTNAKFTQVDGFEKFRSAITQVQAIQSTLQEINED